MALVPTVQNRTRAPLESKEEARLDMGIFDAEGTGKQYALSLVHPGRVRGARVPDMTGRGTATVSAVTRAPISAYAPTDADGFVSYAMVLPFMATHVVQGASGPTAASLPQTWSQPLPAQCYAGVLTTAFEVRLVSMEVVVENNTPLMDSGGVLVMFPSSLAVATSGSSFSVSNFEASSVSSRFTLSSVDQRFRRCWLPVNEKPDTTFGSPTVAAVTVATDLATAGALSVSEECRESTVLVVAARSTKAFKMTMTITSNWEAIPLPTATPILQPSTVYGSQATATEALSQVLAASPANAPERTVVQDGSDRDWWSDLKAAGAHALKHLAPLAIGAIGNGLRLLTAEEYAERMSAHVALVCPESAPLLAGCMLKRGLQIAVPANIPDGESYQVVPAPAPDEIERFPAPTDERKSQERGRNGAQPARQERR